MGARRLAKIGTVMTRLFVIAACIAVLGACGDNATQQQASQDPYSATSSPDATGQPGYSDNPTQWDQITGEDTGRASAATGATEQRLNGLPAGDASADTQQQPAETAP